MYQPIIIFLLELTLLPIVTIRTILMVKSQTGKAATIGGLEALVNVVALGIVFQDMSNFWNIAAYALGFSSGLYVGGLVERKLALGYITYTINLLDYSEELVTHLRNEGFGVTVFEGEGINSPRYRLEVLAKRTRERDFLQIVDRIAPKAFLISHEVRSFKGGYLSKKTR